MNLVIARIPLWIRYVVAAACSAALFVALVLFVSSHNTADSTPAKLGAGKETQQLNQLDTALLVQEEEPKVARVPLGGTPLTVLEHAVRAEVVTLEGEQLAEGPITGTSCARRPGGGASAYTCTVVADSVNYPFDGVLAPARVTYCRVDPSLVDGHTVPVSRRCL